MDDTIEDRTRYIEEYITFELGMMTQIERITFYLESDWETLAPDHVFKPLGFMPTTFITLNDKLGDHIEICPARIARTCELMNSEVFVDYVMTVSNILCTYVTNSDMLTEKERDDEVWEQMDEHERSQIDDQIDLYA